MDNNAIIPILFKSYDFSGSEIKMYAFIFCYLIVWFTVLFIFLILHETSNGSHSPVDDPELNVVTSRETHPGLMVNCPKVSISFQTGSFLFLTRYRVAFQRQTTSHASELWTEERISTSNHIQNQSLICPHTNPQRTGTQPGLELWNPFRWEMFIVQEDPVLQPLATT